MSQPTTTTTRIIETCQIPPPPGSVPPTTLPLTFFDIPYLFHRNPVQRLFFFDLPQTHHFTLTVLPKLKHSLSLALRHFFPLAADLVIPAPPHKPHLLFSEGSSVSFTVAESTLDFDHLLSDDPRDVTDCHPLLPQLTPPSSGGGDARASPLLAIQVTVFPNSGAAVGFSLNHVAADGRAINHFVKSWAFFCRQEASSSPVDLESPPSHDRDGISDPYGLVPIFLEAWRASPYYDSGHRLDDKVRATFVMGPAHIAKLKDWVSAQSREPLTWRLSSFVVAAAYAWVEWIKSRQETEAQVSDTYHLGLPADCRNQNCFEYSIPDTYFGNCLSFCSVVVKRSDALAENGVFWAAKAIGERIKEFREAPLRGAVGWVSNWKKKPVSVNLVIIVGSPNLRVYDTDFGWGRPRKSQVVHVDISGTISLSDYKDGEGGIEIGLALHRDTMETFSASFQRGLALL